VTLDRDHLKRAAAARAIEFVESGMILGLGTGSTAAFVVEELAARIARGLSIVAIPTSERTAGLARQLGIPLTNFAEHHRIDLAIDGADRLGEHNSVPVEVVRFGWQATAAALATLGAAPELRQASEGPFVTDGGNFILDCRFGPIDDPPRTEGLIKMTVGVVENGLFIGRSSAVIVATDSGVDIMTRGGGKVP